MSSEPRRSNRNRAREEAAAQEAASVQTPEIPKEALNKTTKSLKRKRGSASVSKEPKEPTPATPATETVDEVPRLTLPTKLVDGEDLPTLPTPQQSDLPSEDYQTIQQSGVLSASLSISRKQWQSGVNFRLFHKAFTAPKRVADRTDEDKQKLQRQRELSRNFPRISPIDAQLVIEPHTFPIRLYGSKETYRAPPKKPVQYGQWPNHGTQYSPYQQQPKHPQYHNSPAPYQNAPPPQPRPAPKPQPKPPVQSTNTGSTPAPDPVIHMLAARAGQDPELKAIMKIVAGGTANPEQLAFFQRHITELTELLGRQKGAAEKSQLQKRPPPDAPTSQAQNPPQVNQTPQRTQTPYISQSPRTSSIPSQLPQPTITPSASQSNPQIPHSSQILHTPQAPNQPHRIPQAPQSSQVPQAPQAPQSSNIDHQIHNTHHAPVQAHQTPRQSYQAPAHVPQYPQTTQTPHTPQPLSAPNLSSINSAGQSATQPPQPTRQLQNVTQPYHHSQLSGHPPPPHAQQYANPVPVRQGTYQTGYSQPYHANQQHHHHHQSRQSYQQPQQHNHSYNTAHQAPRTYRPLIFDFTNGNGDKFYFPSYSFMEWLPDHRGVKISFLVTKMKPKTESEEKKGVLSSPVSKAEAVTINGTATNQPSVEPPAIPPHAPTATSGTPSMPRPNPSADPNTATSMTASQPAPNSTSAPVQKPVAQYVSPRIEDFDEKDEIQDIEFYQPVTCSIVTSNMDILQALPRAVRPVDAVEKYMNTVFDTCKRADETYLAFRLPKEGAPDAEGTESRVRESSNQTPAASTPVADVVMGGMGASVDKKKGAGRPRKSLVT